MKLVFQELRSYALWSPRDISVKSSKIQKQYYKTRKDVFPLYWYSLKTKQHDHPVKKFNKKPEHKKRRKHRCALVLYIIHGNTVFYYNYSKNQIHTRQISVSALCVSRSSYNGKHIINTYYSNIKHNSSLDPLCSRTRRPLQVNIK